MHANKSFKRNPANHRLYHALMEALIEDENIMDKGVADTMKGHKRKHDDDDEDPLARPNQGKTPTKGSKTSKSAPAKEPVEEPIAETMNPKWFKQPSRPPIPDPEWNKCQVVLDQPTQPWFNQMVSASKDPLTFNNLMATPIDFSKSPGHQTVATDYFLNNDMKYLKTSDPEVTYTTSIMKTKAARYEIKGIEDMVPTLWSTIKHAYDKDALMGIKHWGERRKLWYRSQVNKFSKQNVYSTKEILGVKSVSVKKLHRYGHLEEIVVKRSYQQLYKFKEGDFLDLHLNDIEDMLLLAIQHKLFHLDGNKKLNITKPQKTFPEIEFKEPYTPSYDPPGIVYEDLNKQKRVLRADELYKFSDGTLKSVRDEIHHRVLDFHLDYNTEMPKRKWTVVDRKRSGLMIELIDK
ncbi:hypothetical protein Tco_0324944 [Tanacetum coccineum]